MCSPQTTTYEVGSPDLFMQVFYSIQTDYTKKLTPVFTPISINALGVEQDELKSFLRYEKESNTFVVRSNNPLDAGEYIIGLKIGFKEIKDF